MEQKPANLSIAATERNRNILNATVCDAPPFKTINPLTT
jgi:hypothetical protein